MRPTPASLATLIVAAALALPAAACFKNPNPDCAFECTNGGACPDGYTCRPDGLCKREGVADNFACPDITSVDAAEVDTPDVDAPDIDAPDIDAPDIDAPDIDAPDIDAPDIDAPDIDAPDIDAPDIDAPDIDAAVDAPIDGTPAMLSISTVSLDFGSQTTSTTTMQTVMVTNAGMETTSAITLGISGDSQFALVAGGSDTCTGATLAGSAGCSFEVSFTPDAVQSYTATVTVTATTGGSPSIMATGSGM